MKIKHRQTLLIFSFLVIASLSTSTLVESVRLKTVQADLSIAVSIVPFVEWVEEVGGEYVDVLSLIPDGQSPHIYAPTTTELTFVSNADAWFQAGLIDFDIQHEVAILSSAGFAANDIVNFSQYVELLESVGHDHESPQISQIEDFDPHFWLSPTRAITSIEKIVEKLSSLDPTHASEYATNGANYILELNLLNDTITSQLSSVENRYMLVFHPSWGYFAHDYNLELITLEEEGKEPSSKHYVEVLEEVELHQVGVIFIQEQISVSMAESFAVDACVEVVQLNPLPTNYIESMNETSSILAEKLDQDPVCSTTSKYITWVVLITGITSVTVLIIVVNTKTRRK
ncbi:MAG: metal ABC transporter solute-binding protein, Zn/Mn family [Promethearchaeota archaeon]